MNQPDLITDELRQDILSGAFPPGERLIEANLCEQYGCGRAAVRAALVELGAEGLVDREANRGAAVRRISIEEAIQITEARASLEGLIAAHAARHATDDDRAALTEIVDAMHSAVADNLHREYSALNARLHHLLRDMSRHQIAGELVTNLRNRSAHHQYRLSVMPGRPAESLEQHVAIVEAVVAGNEGGATDAMIKHLQSVIDVLERWGDAST